MGGPRVGLGWPIFNSEQNEQVWAGLVRANEFQPVLPCLILLIDTYDSLSPNSWLKGGGDILWAS